LAICDGLRPEFGKGTPEFYKKFAYRCMDANPNQRPTVSKDWFQRIEIRIRPKFNSGQIYMPIRVVRIKTNTTVIHTLNIFK